MASCYLCGAPRANYRREVSTGRSSSISLRGNFSSRTYYGLRSVCGECADGIDRRNRIHSIVARSLILGIGLLIAATVFCNSRH